MTAEAAFERIEIAEADLTRQQVDAIVNPANAHLANGGGAAGAISRAAGPGLQQACDALIAESGPLPTGGAAITDGFRLPCRRVIHVVGPVYGQHDGEEVELLAAAHRNAISLAAQSGLRSVALPAISCGIFGYPVEEAAPVALSTTAQALAETEGRVELARFCFIGGRERSAFERALEELRG